MFRKGPPEYDRKGNWVAPANRGWKHYTEHEAREGRYWRRTHPEDVRHGRGGSPTHRNPSPADAYPDADHIDMADRRCDCGKRFLAVFRVDGEPVESPSACAACRDREGAVNG